MKRSLSQSSTTGIVEEDWEGHLDHDDALSDNASEAPSEATTVLFRRHAPRTLEERRRALNTLFGFQPWNPHVSKKEIPSQLYDAPDESKTRPQSESTNYVLSPGNIIFFLLIGWWTSLVYFILALLLTGCYITRVYGRLFFQLSWYFFWPFGKYIERHQIPKAVDVEHFGESVNVRESSHLVDDDDDSPKMFLPGAAGVPAAIIYYLFIIPFVSALHLVCWIICWFLVVLIPMAKIHSESLMLIVREPLIVGVGNRFPPPTGANIALCTYSAVNKSYLKYTVGGLNVVLFNLYAVVFLAIFCGFLTSDKWREDHSALIFVLCIISTIPLAYQVGFAVATISAQSSFAVGAILNATFGSLIELIIYFFALKKGLNGLVQQAVSGSLLGLMLLLPGLSMIVGGLRHKIQRFNTNAAGVSAVLLIIAITGDFTPTLFYMLYGQYDIRCQSCTGGPDDHWWCQECKNVEDIDHDPVYTERAKPLMYICSSFLPIAYFVGLLFTLKTHTHFYEKKGEHSDPEEGDVGGHDTLAEWSVTTCVVVLVIDTLLFALVAEAMTNSIEPFLTLVGMSEQFAGLTVIAVVPNFVEFVNALMFAYNNNITLALEIGSVAAVQVSLIQMPALVLMSLFMHSSTPSKSFSLVYPHFDVFAVFVSVIIVTYISIDGRCNYFEGTALLLIYVIILAAFWFIPY